MDLGSNFYASVTFNEKAQLDFFKPMVSQLSRRKIQTGSRVQMMKGCIQSLEEGEV